MASQKPELYSSLWASCDELRGGMDASARGVVEDKWLAALDAAIHGEMDRVSQSLTRRVKELAERYETPLPRMAERVVELEARVAAHLARMGFA